MSRPPFHLAFPVHDLDAARAFYGDVLECREGRSSERWVDFDFHGHQIVAHLVDSATRPDPDAGSNAVDSESVPVPHFGLILPWEEWEGLAARLESAHACFVIRPTVRFRGQTGEQATTFVRDPSGNALEFKAFRNPEEIFIADEH